MSLRSRPPSSDGLARLHALMPAPVAMGSEGGGWTPAQELVEDPFWPEPSWEPSPWEIPDPDAGSRPAEVVRPAAVPVAGESGTRLPEPESPVAGPSAGVSAGSAHRGAVATTVLGVLRAGRVDVGRRGVLALVLVGVVAAAVAAVLLLRGHPSVQPVEVPPVLAGAPQAAPTSRSEVVVAVAGRVRRPGLVHLPAGSRVADALAAVGGALPAGADGLLNLARRLVDGEQVLVGVAAPGGSPPGAVGGSPPGQLDLNAAAAGDLDGLPGIGPVLAQRIVDWRTEHGRFASVDQLREVAGIGEAKYQSMKSKVRV